MTDITWTNERRRVKDLIPWEKNPRKISEDQLAHLKKSIERFGYAAPVVLDADGMIIAGHMRTKAMIALGMGETEVDVRIASRKLTAAEFEELALRDNANGASWDMEKLLGIDKDIISSVGFESDFLDKLFKEPAKKELDNSPDPPQEARTISGNVYALGDHRLMCGDATNMEDVRILMAGKKAQMIHTDPPYNVDYGASKKHRHKIRTIENDHQTQDEWEAFCKALYLIFQEVNEGDIYMWGASSPEGMKMRLWLVEAGCHWSATIIWKKDQLVLTPANYQRMYEPCFYGWFDKSSFGEDRKQTEVWEIERPKSSKLHPTMKPIEVCGRAIRNSSKRGDTVLDLFGGSGSTLIACEELGRRCNMMEIDPRYCDVIVQRWEAFTGQKAELVA